MLCGVVLYLHVYAQIESIHIQACQPSPTAVHARSIVPKPCLANQESIQELELLDFFGIIGVYA